jgi:hypothetical protein
MFSWKPGGGLSGGPALTWWVGTLAIVMSVEYTRHARDTNTVYLDAASIAQVVYIWGKPTAVKSTKN